MLKREVKYKDFNDEEVVEVFYFNLSVPEVIEMNVEYKGGMAALLERIIETNDMREIIKQFKAIILMAYGKKSDDGKRFIKSDQLREEFEQSAAYHVLFMELVTNAGAAADFIKGVLPRDAEGKIDKALEAATSAPTPTT